MKNIMLSFLGRLFCGGNRPVGRLPKACEAADADVSPSLPIIGGDDLRNSLVLLLNERLVLFADEVFFRDIFATSVAAMWMASSRSNS